MFSNDNPKLPHPPSAGPPGSKTNPYMKGLNQQVAGGFNAPPQGATPPPAPPLPQKKMKKK